MLNHFALLHLPALFVSSAMTFGGLIPFLDPEYATLEFGLPKRIAISPPAQAVMILCSGRTTALGLSLWTFYVQGKLVEFDTVLIILGAYVGLVDGYVCAKEGVPGKAVLRTGSGLVIATWGLFGLTSKGVHR